MFRQLMFIIIGGIFTLCGFINYIIIDEFYGESATYYQQSNIELQGIDPISGLFIINLVGLSISILLFLMVRKPKRKSYVR